MVPVLKLPFIFDATKLRADLARFGEDEWTPHFNTQYYEGDWSGIALRAARDAHVELYPDPTASAYANTAQMARCIYIPTALETLECDLESARFLRLTPGAEIREHRDFKLSVDDGIARVHIPVKTNPEVEFMLGGERVEMLEGEAWYLNFNLPHSVKNHSDQDRVHLVIDCVVNDRFRSFFPQPS
jgi:hypothetical protein